MPRKMNTAAADKAALPEFSTDLLENLAHRPKKPWQIEHLVVHLKNAIAIGPRSVVAAMRRVGSRHLNAGPTHLEGQAHRSVSTWSLLWLRKLIDDKHKN